MKKIAVVLEHRFYEHEGKLYTALAFDYAYWLSYLTFFDEVCIVARIESVSSLREGFRLASGAGVVFEKIPYYIGAGRFISQMPKVFVSAFRISKLHDKFILRSGNLSNIFWVCLSLQGKKYLREYPGDLKLGITHFFSDSGKRVNIIKKIWVISVANLFHLLGKIQARQAVASSYVSESVRTTYPAQNRINEFVFSSIELPDEKYIKVQYECQTPMKVICVGRLEAEKGHSTLVSAIKLLEGQHRSLHLTLDVCGDGSQLPVLSKMSLDMDSNVVFHGAITDKSVLYSLIRDADVFVLPSFTEGMPRALLECMCIGTPVVAFDVGGVSEVLTGLGKVSIVDSQRLAEEIDLVIAQSSVEREGLACARREQLRNRYSKSNMDSIKHRFWESI